MFSRRIDELLELRPVDERLAEELTALVRRDLNTLADVYNLRQLG